MLEAVPAREAARLAAMQVELLIFGNDAGRTAAAAALRALAAGEVRALSPGGVACRLLS